MSLLRHRQTVTRRPWMPALVMAAVLPALLLFGCATPDSARQTAQSTPTTHNDKPAPPSALTPELLYDLLLGDIAGQLGHNKVAIESLSRAAYQSRDRRVIEQAIGLAVRLQDHRRVIELSRLMDGIAPLNFRNQLALANAQFATGQEARAFAILTDLARNQRAAQSDGWRKLQAIASLLARQPSPQIMTRFGDASAAWPDNPQLKLTAALLAYELKQDAPFRQLIDQTLQLRPQWETAAMLKLTHLSQSSPPQMPPFADGYLKQFPDAKRFRIHYGRLLFQGGRNKQSLRQLETVLKQDPQSSEALFASAIAYLEQDNPPKALQRFKRFLALNPHSDQARLYIADIHITRENYDAAAAVLREVASEEYYLDAQVTLASVLAERDGVEVGIRHLREIAVHHAGEAVRVILEQDLLYRKFKLFELAKEVLDEGLERIPGDPDLLYNRGLLAVELNLLDLHERDMRALIVQQPDNAHAYNALGYTLADQTDRLDEALELITKALEIMPDDPFILDSMGWVNFRIGNNDKAIEYLRRALSVRKDAEIAAHLGEALWVAGNKREAREIWEQGKEWSPDNATLLDTLKRFSPETSSGIFPFSVIPAPPQ